MNKGKKVLIRVMECTSTAYDQWEVVYKTGTILQDDVLTVGTKKLYTVELSNGSSEHVWSNHILDYPKEWVDRQSDLC